MILLLIDVVDEEEVVLVDGLRRCQFGFGRERLKTEKEESSHQIGTILAIFLHAQNDTVALQLLLRKVQEGDEWLFRRCWQQNWWQCNIQDTSAAIENLNSPPKKSTMQKHFASSSFYYCFFFSCFDNSNTQRENFHWKLCHLKLRKKKDEWRLSICFKFNCK